MHGYASLELLPWVCGKVFHFGDLQYIRCEW